MFYFFHGKIGNKNRRQADCYLYEYNRVATTSIICVDFISSSGPFRDLREEYSHSNFSFQSKERKKTLNAADLFLWPLNFSPLNVSDDVCLAYDVKFSLPKIASRRNLHLSATNEF